MLDVMNVSMDLTLGMKVGCDVIKCTVRMERNLVLA